MIESDVSRYEKYQTFYFERDYHLSDIQPTDLLMLHNSWTPEWYKKLSLDEVLSIDAEGNEMMLADVLCDQNPSVLTKLTEDEDIHNLYTVLNHLNDREKEIIIMRFGLNGHVEMTQKEVADYLGISQSYISRLEKRILSKMRQEIEELVTFV